MGGHGGLNILPQKRWNVYNYENREKVRRDEEAAAKEEQLKREQSRQRDAEFRLERLRQARGVQLDRPDATASTDPKPSDSNHINLFEGLKLFPFEADHVAARQQQDEEERDRSKKPKKDKKRAVDDNKAKLPEDEKYRLGYGVAGKGVKAPWYLSRPGAGDEKEEEKEKEDRCGQGKGESRSERKEKSTTKKKTVEELREERLKRERKEKERERELLFGKKSRERPSSFGRLR